MNQPEKIKDSKAPKALFRIKYVLGWLLILFFILEICSRIFFAKPGLLLRNEGIGTQAMDYFFEQMDKDPVDMKIAWIGASVMQGLKNVPPGKTYPLVANKLLKEKDLHISGYNLSTAGVRVGDTYLILHEAIKHGAKVVPIALHLKTFSGKRFSIAEPVLYKDSSYYLMGHPEFVEIREKDLHVNTSSWMHILLDKSISRIWAFYRYSGMVFPMLSKSDKPPMDFVKHQYLLAMGLANEFVTTAATMDYEYRNQDDIWLGIPKVWSMANKSSYTEVNLTKTNPLWRLIDRITIEAGQQKVVILFFFSPLNKLAIEKHDQFPWPLQQRYVDIVSNRIKSSGFDHIIADMTNAVEPKYFTDFDHMNINGHRQLAHEMIPYLEKAILKSEMINK